MSAVLKEDELALSDNDIFLEAAERLRIAEDAESQNRIDGIQALATSLASGAVQVLNYGGSSLSLVQTLTVSGAVGVAIAGDSVLASTTWAAWRRPG